MPNRENFDNVLTQLAQFAEDIGDEVVIESDPQIIVREDGEREETEYIGHSCTHGNTVYFVAGLPEQRYVEIIYPYSLLQNIANHLSPAVAQGVVDDNYEETEDVRMEAAESLLNDVPQEKMDYFRSHLYLTISGGTYATNVQSNNDGSLTFIEICKNIFPFEDSFDISSYNDSVQLVASAGTRAQNVINNTVYIYQDDENPEESEIVINS